MDAHLHGFISPVSITLSLSGEHRKGIPFFFHPLTHRFQKKLHEASSPRVFIHAHRSHADSFQNLVPAHKGYGLRQQKRPDLSILQHEKMIPVTGRLRSVHIRNQLREAARLYIVPEYPVRETQDFFLPLRARSDNLHFYLLLFTGRSTQSLFFTASALRLLSPSKPPPLPSSAVRWVSQRGRPSRSPVPRTALPFRWHTWRPPLHQTEYSSSCLRGQDPPKAAH